jgi:hypothetical protein
MYVGDTTAESRANWITALDRLAALNPKIAIAGHKKPGAPDRRAVLLLAACGDPQCVIGQSPLNC